MNSSKGTYMSRLPIAAGICLLPALIVAGCAPKPSSNSEALAPESTPETAVSTSDLAAPNTDLGVGLTSLHYAAGNGTDVITVLIDNGAEVDARDDRGFTPLRYAAGSSDDPGVLRTLINAGANVNATSLNEGTPLFSAAFSNENPEILTVLINAGATVNVQNLNGSTPLSMAAQFNKNPEIVRVLINAGAKLNTRDGSGNSPLMDSVGYGGSGPEVLTLLINAGAEVNARNNKGRTALDIAMSMSTFDNTRKIELLRAAGAKQSKDLP